MTIIQPHKTNYKITFFISFCVISILGIAVWGIFLYNQSVNFRHELTNQEDTLRKVEVANAEFKDKLYNITDINSLGSQPLILEKNPEYVKSKSLVASD